MTLLPHDQKNPQVRISGNDKLLFFIRLAEAEAVLVGDDSSMVFGNTCSTVIDKVSTEFTDASAFALQVSALDSESLMKLKFLNILCCVQSDEFNVVPLHLDFVSYLCNNRACISSSGD